MLQITNTIKPENILPDSVRYTVSQLLGNVLEMRLITLFQASPCKNIMSSHKKDNVPEEEDKQVTKAGAKAVRDSPIRLIKIREVTHIILILLRSR